MLLVLHAFSSTTLFLSVYCLFLPPFPIWYITEYYLHRYFYNIQNIFIIFNFLAFFVNITTSARRFSRTTSRTAKPRTFPQSAFQTTSITASNSPHPANIWYQPPQRKPCRAHFIRPYLASGPGPHARTTTTALAVENCTRDLLPVAVLAGPRPDITARTDPYRRSRP